MLQAYLWKLLTHVNDFGKNWIERNTFAFVSVPEAIKIV